MKHLSRLGLAAAVAVASLTSIGAAAPAQAAGSGLQLKVVSYDWTPRTGNLEVTAKVGCPRRVTSASWALKVKQRVSAKGFQKISCTGEPQLLTLVLDPKNGRFHPGAATQELTTVECISDFCAGITYEPQTFRIPPPGKSRATEAR
ncbi:MAG: hypothetical protein LH630_00275 [Actinomycetia bacterium]|nr:hypothetical protein [Actinomycetes bacterium]